MTCRFPRASGFIAGTFATLCVLFAACARQAPPPGGPEDRTPPRVVSATPPANAVNVPVDSRIEVRFSERVDRRSVESSLFVTPYMGDLEVKVRGSRVELKRSRPLREDATYVITIGSDVRDLRSNPMGQSFTWAFATGDSLNRGQISGRVYDDAKVQGILVWAYILGDHDPDPATDPADYVTQTDTEGGYELTFLAPGRYRLFAVRDMDNTRTYQPETDALGVPARDVLLDSSRQQVGQINFRVTVRDTTPPVLDSAHAPDRHHVELRFSEPLHPDGLQEPGNFVITAAGTLKVQLAYPDPQSTRQVVLVTEEQQPDVTYTITVRGVRDLWDWPIDSLGATLEFVGSATADTIRPRVRGVAPTDSAVAVPLDSVVEVTFSEAMDTLATAEAFAVTDAAGVRAAGRPEWASPQVLRYRPDSTWSEKTRYRVSLDLSRCVDLAGNSAADSTLTSVFTTLSRDTLSAISGRVLDPAPEATGAIHLRIRQSATAVSYTTVLPDTGRYEFRDILPGVYVLDAFRDRDGNGRYSWGSAIPFEPAERFVVYPDSIAVRSRWPNEGNEITFWP